ncbi:glycosyltransferase family 4 protein [Thiobacter aerophilum]|uniref:Glycosyltransferase family 4 protein n=1 Tax=Thiobacter aerophilum TaxID=3121275 RepID=A0ABV0EGB5_9BURK
MRNRIFNKMFRLGVFTYPQLVESIERIRPELIHFHNRQELVDAVTRRLSYKPAIVVHYHRHFAKPIIPSLADLLVFVSRRTKEYVLEKSETTKPYAIVHNPLSMEVLALRESVAGVPAPNDPPVILFGGGGSPLKGGKELIRAFSRLPPGSARLILAGSGVEHLPGLPHPHIEIAGKLSAPEFLDLMRRADIVAMPSLDEPFGLIAQEAMALGRLPLVAQTGGLAEFTGPDCAVVIDPTDPASLESGLKRGLDLLRPDHAAEREILLSNARARLRTLLPEIAVAKLEEAYDQALAHQTQKWNITR